MNTFHHITAALLTTLTIGLIPAGQTAPAEAAEPITAPATPTVATEIVEAPAPAQLALVDATAEQADMVDAAIAQFDAAGLELPALQIEFYNGNEGCNGHAGLFLAESRDPEANVDRITICSQMKVILLHELAHAWKHHNLDDGTREAFTAHWGLDGWNDSHDAWGDRGIERAAHTIAFTLNQAETTDSESVLRYVCGYELLTGDTIEIHTKVKC